MATPLPRFLFAAVIVCVSVPLWAGPPLETAKDIEVYDREGFHEAVMYTHHAMGSEFVFIVHRSTRMTEEALTKAVQEAFDAIDALEMRISTWRPESQTTYVNENAHRIAVRVSQNVFDLIAFCKELHGKTDGVFDITIGPVLEVHGFYWGQGRRPPEHKMEEALAKVGMEQVRLNADDLTVSLGVSGMKMDFGGVGKGLALDVAADILRKRGVVSARLDGAKSTITAIGAPPGESGWTVNLSDPYNPERFIDTVLVRDATLSTSGCIDDFEDLQGEQMCDILDPRTGRPVTGVLSVHVLAKTGIEADALSTAFVVLGPEKTAEYCRKNSGVRAIYIPEPNQGEPVPIRIGFGPHEDKQ